MSEELMTMIERLVLDAYGTQGLEYLRQRTRPAPAVQVPEGFTAVPTAALEYLADQWPGAYSKFYAKVDECLAAAPTPATVATLPLSDIDADAMKGAASYALATVATEAVAQVSRETLELAQRIIDALDDKTSVYLSRVQAVDTVLRDARAVAQGGGVDVEKVMALVAEYGAEMCDLGMHNAEGYALGSRQDEQAAAAVLVKLRALLASAPAVPVGDGWMPIETAPEVKGEYFWCWLAWGADEDKCKGYGMRWNGRWFAASSFYHMNDDRKYKFREHEVKPTHWQPLPPAPAATKEGE